MEIGVGNPAVSVVLPTCNRPQTLRGTMESLGRQSVDFSFEILVVDNGDPTITRPLVESFEQEYRNRIPVSYLYEARKGSSYARNKGLENAKGTILAFCDDDELIDPRWLSVIKRNFDAYPDVVALTGKVVPIDGSVLPQWVNKDVQGALGLLNHGDEGIVFSKTGTVYDSGKQDHGSFTMIGANMAARTDVLKEIGGFDVRCLRSQDRELTVRLILAGKKIRYVPDMVTSHICDNRTVKSHFRKWSRMEGQYRALYQYFELFTRQGDIGPPNKEVPRILGVSRFVYRQFLEQVWMCVKYNVKLRRDQAFVHENRAIMLLHYIFSSQRIHAKKTTDQSSRNISLKRGQL
ncbi:MAG TPA: glycosyltransferase [Candidatus Binatia bacterium]|nr:glycosyltransferase [Candidatus Binatia bacterium]